MEPNLSVGDVSIIKKTSPNDVKIGDIIEYQMEEYTVIHRVTEIYQEDGRIFFITKGDNNQSEDRLPVSENQLIGKVIYNIRYIGLPSIWLHSSDGNVDIETGN